MVETIFNPTDDSGKSSPDSFSLNYKSSKNENDDNSDDANLQSFPEKTFHLVNRCDKDSSEIACWSDEGDAFTVKKPDRLAEMFKPTYFSHSNFSTFNRQLNIYGFSSSKSKKSPYYTTYRHEYFLKGQRCLLDRIKRRAKNSTPAKISNEEVSELRNMMCGIDKKLEEVSSKVDKLMIVANLQSSDSPIFGKSMSESGGINILQSNEESHVMSKREGFKQPFLTTLPPMPPTTSKEHSSNKSYNGETNKRPRQHDYDIRRNEQEAAARTMDHSGTEKIENANKNLRHSRTSSSRHDFIGQPFDAGIDVYREFEQQKTNANYVSLPQQTVSPFSNHEENIGDPLNSLLPDGIMEEDEPILERDINSGNDDITGANEPNNLPLPDPDGDNIMVKLFRVDTVTKNPFTSMGQDDDYIGRCVEKNGARMFAQLTGSLGSRVGEKFPFRNNDVDPMCENLAKMCVYRPQQSLLVDLKQLWILLKMGLQQEMLIVDEDAIKSNSMTASHPSTCGTQDDSTIDPDFELGNSAPREEEERNETGGMSNTKTTVPPIPNNNGEVSEDEPQLDPNSSPLQTVPLEIATRTETRAQPDSDELRDSTNVIETSECTWLIRELKRLKEESRTTTHFFKKERTATNHTLQDTVMQPHE